MVWFFLFNKKKLKKIALMWHQDWHNEKHESEEINHKDNLNQIPNESDNKQQDGRIKMNKRELSSYSINGADEKKIREDICSDEDVDDYNHIEFDSERDFNDLKRDDLMIQNDENSLQSLPEKLCELNY